MRSREVSAWVITAERAAIAGLALLATLVARPERAVADPAKPGCSSRAFAAAKAHHAKAGRLAAKRRYTEALEELNLAYRLCHNPVLLLNMGEVSELAKDDLGAVARYKQYLLKRPTGKSAGKARKAVTRLEKRLAGSHARLQLRTQPEGGTVVLDGEEDEAEVAPVDRWLEPGKHRVSVRLGGHRPLALELVLEAGQTESRTLELVPERPSEPTAAAPEPPVQSPEPPVQPPEPPGEPGATGAGDTQGSAGSSTLRPWAAGGLAAAAVVAGVGTALLFGAAAREDDDGDAVAARAYPTPAAIAQAQREAEDHYAKAARMRNIALGVSAAGAVALASAAYLVFVAGEEPAPEAEGGEPGSESEARLRLPSLWADPSQRMVGMALRF